MRSSIDAQSWASVPPEPAWMSMKQLLASTGLENLRRNSSPPPPLSRFPTSPHTPPSKPTRLWHQKGATIREITFEVCDQYTLQADAFARAILDNTPVPTP